MESKKIIQTLIKIAENQQKIIEKLAQQLPPQTLSVGDPTKKDAAAILHALPPTVKPLVATVEVHGSDVMVQFHPGQDSDQAFQAVVNTVNSLQRNNVLVGKNYQVKSVG